VARSLIVQASHSEAEVIITNTIHLPPEEEIETNMIHIFLLFVIDLYFPIFFLVSFLNFCPIICITK
jgi:hypothetical protein